MVQERLRFDVKAKEKEREIEKPAEVRNVTRIRGNYKPSARREVFIQECEIGFSFTVSILSGNV